MNKHSEKQSEIKVFDKTFKVLEKREEFQAILKKAYQMIMSRGKKKEIHINVIERTQPKRSLILARSYCANPEKIPAKDFEFYTSIMSHEFFYAISEEIEKNKILVDELKKIQELLTPYFRFFEDKLPQIIN